MDNKTEVMKPGHMRVYRGDVIDLNAFSEKDVRIEDIAWGLGRTLRYGGHIKQDYTVAHHSIIMSYAVPKRFAMEALLHDAAEAYMGDIIWPVKALFPAVERFENKLALVIMDRFKVPVAAEHDPAYSGVGRYMKSNVIQKADDRLREHECISMDRPGVWHDDIEKAWLEAIEHHAEWWWAPWFAFLQRFDELTGEVHFKEDGPPTDELQNLWFPPDQEMDEALEEIAKADGEE